MKESQKVTVKYSSGLDALYIWFIPKKKSKLISVDGGYFFLYQSEDEPKEICGYEWLDFSYFVDDDGVVDLPIPEPDLRFDVVGTEVKGLSLKELVFWAYKRFVGLSSERELIGVERR